MVIVGLNFAHDAGVCVVEDGRVIGLFQRERFTRVKRQAFLPADFLIACLSRCGVDWRDVDRVAVSSSQAWPICLLDPDRFRIDHDVSALDRFPLHGISADVVRNSHRLLAQRKAYATYWYERATAAETHLYNEYFGEDRLSAAAQDAAVVSYDWITWRPAWFNDFGTDRVHGFLETVAKNRSQGRAPHLGYGPITVTLDGVAKPGLMVPHHLCHAAAAYYPSDRSEALIYTLDNGDGVSHSGYTGGFYCVGSGNRIAAAGPAFDFHAHLYQRVAESLNLGGGGGAGKLMGLAPYGADHFFDPSLVGDSFDVLGRDIAMGMKPKRDAVLEPLYAIFRERNGQIYRGSAPISPHHDPDAFGAENVVCPDIDVAMAAQMTFEENTLRTIRRFRAAADAAGVAGEHLVLSGGAALNCPANSRLHEETDFASIFVPPYCDDSGLPLGAALAMAHDVLDLPRQPIAPSSSEGAYLGCSYDDRAVDAAVASRAGAIEEEICDDPARSAAADIAGGAIIAWYEGASEVGPRALGHRSILADPRDPAKWRQVNAVKRREYWRPFAPAVLREKCDAWFSGTPVPSPFMLFNAQVRVDSLPAITHVDGSARVQTVDAACGGFRSVLEAFDAVTGVPVVLNTSFNGPGEPIVETPDEALAFLTGSEIDAVYVNGRRFIRRSDA